MNRLKKVGVHRARLGESPIWHADECCIYHIDILGQELIRTDIDTGHQAWWSLPGPPGSIAPLSPAGVLVALPDGLYAFDAQTASLALHQAVDFIAEDWRFNDATVDPRGRFIAGTCKQYSPRPTPNGALWQFVSGQSPKKLLEGFYLLNGLAFSPDGGTLYFSDSAAEVSKIWRCSYDVAGGDLGERSLFLDMTGTEGRPDGAAVDCEGGYWIAAAEAGAVMRHGPDAAVLTKAFTGTPRPSKPVFAGNRLDRLFVTTVSENLEDDGLAGALLELAVDVRGWPVPPFGGCPCR